MVVVVVIVVVEFYLVEVKQLSSKKMDGLPRGVVCCCDRFLVFGTRKILLSRGCHKKINNERAINESTNVIVRRCDNPYISAITQPIKSINDRDMYLITQQCH